MSTDDLISQLPGEHLIRQGLADFQSGRVTIESCLVAIARPRLTAAGLLSSDTSFIIKEAELRLYGLLRREGGDAYSRYNALIRELVSFENALGRRISKGV